MKIRHDGEYMYLCEKKELTCEYNEWKNRIKRVIIDTDRVCMGPGGKANGNAKRYESALE